MPQPFYHRMDVLFTATTDLSDVANGEEFKAKLRRFLRRNLGKEVIPDSVDYDAPVDAEAGDPHDLA